MSEENPKLKPLHLDMDARRWADEFMMAWDKYPDKPDYSWMVSWFANSIMCGYDNSRWDKEKELEKKDAEILEQARLLGKSAEREADLLGKLERKDKLCSELLQALKEADDKGLFS